MTAPRPALLVLVRHAESARNQAAASWPEGQAPPNRGVTTYRCAASGDHLELGEYNRVYRTVGSPEDGVSMD